jgi:hypothetical protein
MDTDKELDASESMAYSFVNIQYNRIILSGFQHLDGDTTTKTEYVLERD